MSALIIPEPVQKIKTFVDAMENEFKSVQVEKSVEFQSEAHFALQALINNDFLLQTARKDPTSLKNAILNIGAIGLTLNPVSQLAYLVPRKNKICLDISYKGLIRTATDSGSIIWAQSELVYEKDEFVMNSSGEKPTHKFNPFIKDRGTLMGCYVVAKTWEGDFLTTAMQIDEIYDIRNKSEAFKKGHGPWVDFEGEMIKKTVIKRASKLWPRTKKIDRLEKAIDVINEHEGIDFEKEKSFEDCMREDFPDQFKEQPVNDDYVVMYAKFRGKKLGQIPTQDLMDYFEELQKRVFSTEKTAKKWENELYNVLNEYLSIVNDND